MVISCLYVLRSDDNGLNIKRLQGYLITLTAFFLDTTCWRQWMP